MKLSIYEIITGISYSIAFVVFLIYGYQLRDYSNPMHTNIKKIYTYFLFFIIYTPFICTILSIFYRKRVSQYNIYIISHSLIILFIISPMILFKDSILSMKFSGSYYGSDLMDNIKYDSHGTCIMGEKFNKDDPNYQIRKRAAESEFHNRSDINRGFYE